MATRGMAGAGSFAWSLASGVSTAGLVAEWKFDAGHFLTDTSSTGATLTQIGTVSQVAGLVGDAASFPNALGCYLTVADSTAYHFASSGFTVAFWVKNTSGANQATVYKWSSTNSEWALLLNPSNFLNFYIQGGLRLTSPVALTSGVWNFVAAGYDFANSLAHLQVNNGALQSVSFTTLTNTTQAIALGEDGTDALYPLNGLLDQVRIYNSWQSSTVLTALYNGGAGI